jgi:hypothetical protein
MLTTSCMTRCQYVSASQLRQARNDLRFIVVVSKQTARKTRLDLDSAVAGAVSIAAIDHPESVLPASRPYRWGEFKRGSRSSGSCVSSVYIAVARRASKNTFQL